MTIPKKGSRKVDVDDGNRVHSFRYLVKETHIPDHRDQKELSVTVQEDAPNPGNVLQFRAAYGVLDGTQPCRIACRIMSAT